MLEKNLGYSHVELTGKETPYIWKEILCIAKETMSLWLGS